MVHYRIFYSHPHRHFISFEARFPTHGQSTIRLQLPAWRPGRYELGNFAKNIRMFHLMDEFGKILPFEKRSKDLWEVQCSGLSEVVVRYQYYAEELNAGSTYLDEEQLYINPVNCFLYDEQHTEQPYRLEVNLPERYRIATGLKKENDNVLLASCFDELADSPFIASPSLNHLKYSVEDVTYHVWIQGKVKLDEERLINEFKAFTYAQLKIFKSIPCSEYHFLFQFVPYWLRHGVEHCNSTVITMGPATAFADDAGHKDLLGISCHELFHTWNVKNIRPIEMMPYDFSKENYSSLGFVAEGVTTYYGDLLLWTTASISDREWFDHLSDSINKHVSNPGRFNLSVAESSFETWLDGYVQGIPWRKVSIYNEGSLIAFICDALILRATNGKFSLDDAMQKMYDDFGKTSKGYSSSDYKKALEEVSGVSFDAIFKDIIFGRKDYIPFLKEALDTVGMRLEKYYPISYSEKHLGMTISESMGHTLVLSVEEGSPADEAKLWVGDEILAVNYIAITSSKSLDMLMEEQDGNAELTVQNKNKIRKVSITTDESLFNLRYRVFPNETPDALQAAIYERWKLR